MLRQLIRTMSGCPPLFDGLRWLLEGGFVGHESVFQREIDRQSLRTLDVGCGTGLYAPRFDPDRYLGIDCSAAYVLSASRKCPEHSFIVADACRLPLADQSFAGSIVSGVLHHLSDAEVGALLSEVSRVLQSDGTLTIWEDIPTRNWWNIAGHCVHRLDVGQFIRHPEEYQRLIARYFRILSQREMRSGLMDYVVFACQVVPGAPGSDVSSF